MPTQKWKFYRDKMLKLKSYILLFIAALSLIIYSFVSDEQDNLRINIHDTYYVMTKIDSYKFFSAFLLGLALLYLLLDVFRLKLFSILNLIHIYGTLMLFGLLNYYNYYNSLVYKSVNLNGLFDVVDYNSYIVITVFAIIFLQFLFIINIFASLIKGFRTSR
jgi:hypothetical protein